MEPPMNGERPGENNDILGENATSNPKDEVGVILALSVVMAVFTVYMKRR